MPGLEMALTYLGELTLAFRTFCKAAAAYQRSLAAYPRAGSPSERSMAWREAWRHSENGTAHSP